ncbi:di-heme oxidoredictase family protein [Hansschlegelia zhihuaiae]|uniref:Cytochrome c domain-containing protein n=1 Tax=Hansschlegelia zhihuaiae TaxID=405005 RepID=A0A4Q0MMG8_9HYPH|nr:di-heme oxidoredictase family protein [Hansschlegelia zhihuaiae]RXF74981.1 hypothetical protein EK403_02680 [Hansschlegelia zhihuaiae]
MAARAAVLSLVTGVATAASIAVARDLDVAVGKAVFDRLWVQAPSSTKSADGLGPLFAARSCSACHGADGKRARFLLGRDDPAATPGLVLRLADAKGRPDPVYGAQLQPAGLGGAPGEGEAAASRPPAPGPSVKPEWRVDGLAYGALGAGARVSARVAPSLAGLGLLARVPDAAIVAREDPDDRDGDGVSGRAARLASGEIGRLGWKATEPTLQAQAEAAFALDLGLSTRGRPDPVGDCTSAQVACRQAPNGGGPGEPEVGPELLAGLVAFLKSRPAPAHPATGRGEDLFEAVGCGACHVPSLALADGGEARAFSDLLLHDMGSGLDDGAAEGAAASPEWRTAPLWGLSETLALGSGLLHDGRAGTVAEAIAWHGGEAAAARARFEKLAPHERQALLDYLNDL